MDKATPRHPPPPLPKHFLISPLARDSASWKLKQRAASKHFMSVEAKLLFSVQIKDATSLKDGKARKLTKHKWYQRADRQFCGYRHFPCFLERD